MANTRTPVSRIGVIVAAIALILIAAVAPVSAAQAATGGTITTQSKCLDDPDYSTQDGTAIQLFNCNGATAQSWSWEADGTVRVFGKCLDVRGASNANGALLQLYTCVSGVPQQKFSALPDGTIYSADSAKCLAVQGSAVNGAKIGLAPCDPLKPEQQWNASTAPKSPYTLTGAAAVENTYGSDTPSFPYIDKDGTFYVQHAHALYSANDPREWKFFTGSNVDTLVPSPLNDSVNPSNALDKNNDTTWRCNNSPTGSKATAAPSAGQAGASYAHRNYCDLAGVWVDPDSGDWYGLVHNEMTPEPFGDGMHFDAIDYAISKDQGRTWKITAEVLTSPFSTKRGDTAAFPADNYYYGDGDQRLFVDNASGYFYVFYASRTIAKPGVQGGQSWLQHVARAPISEKMAPSSWRKWYNGAWVEPGVGGRESNIIPADGGGPGYTSPAEDYKPTSTGSQPAQVAAGTLPDDSQLAVMNIAWNAYLQKYIGTPQSSIGQDTGTKRAQKYYVTDDLATQKWTEIGSVDANKNASWYRWMVDSGSLTGGSIIGKTFRAYCTIECSTSNFTEYVQTTIDVAASARPTPPVAQGTSYRITAGSNRVLTQNGTSVSIATSPTGAATEKWRFNSTSDGFFTITNASTGQALGVNGSVNAGRAWSAGVAPQTLATTGSALVAQQWSFQRIVTTPGTSGSSVPTTTYRLINRYSGLALSLETGNAVPVATSPVRQWIAPAGSADTRTPAGQTLTIAAQ